MGEKEGGSRGRGVWMTTDDFVAVGQKPTHSKNEKTQLKKKKE